MRDTFLPFGLPLVGNEEKQEILDVLESGWLTTGPRTKLFEHKFAEYIGAKHAVAVNSCTAALHLSLLSCGVTVGDEVITSPFTFAATGNTIVHCGARPVFADIDPVTCNIDPEKIEKHITSRTKALIVVHYAGQPCDMDRIQEITKRHGLKLIEDAAHAVGTEYHGVKVGTFGDTACFSFYPTKTMTTGEGGMITTNDDSIADMCRVLALHGISKDAWQRYSDKGNWYYEIMYPGFKYNMSDLQAALGIHQLDRLDEFITIRERYARRFDVGLAEIPWIDLPLVGTNIRHSWHLYPIRIKSGFGITRDELITKLREKNIGASVHFIPLHLHPYYAKTYGYKRGDYPFAEAVFESILSLPLYPKMDPSDIDYVIDSIKEFVTS